MIQKTAKMRKLAHRCESQLKAEKGNAVSHYAAITPERYGAHTDFIWTQLPPLIAHLCDNPSPKGTFSSTYREKTAA